MMVELTDGIAFEKQWNTLSKEDDTEVQLREAKKVATLTTEVKPNMPASDNHLLNLQCARLKGIKALSNKNMNK